MKLTAQHSPEAGPATAHNAAIQKGLVLLLEAHGLAQDLQKHDWEFAVELPVLVQAGCTRSAMRWLVSQGYARHVVEKTRKKSARRSFCEVGNLSFSEKSCFLLTPTGLALAIQQLGPPAAGETPRPTNLNLLITDGKSTPRPRWDLEFRELSVGDVLVKAFTQPAKSQEIILTTFEEDAWSPRIDNPLSPHHGRDSKKQLHDAIRRLNDHQQHRLIRFRSDNNGEGIRWELIRR